MNIQKFERYASHKRSKVMTLNPQGVAGPAMELTLHLLYSSYA